MPLQMQLEDGLYMPVAVCDHCGQRIEDAKQGNYEWRVHRPDYDTDGQAFFTHKQCSHGFRLANPVPDGRWYCMELRELTARLSHNIKQTWQDIKQETVKITGPAI